MGSTNYELDGWKKSKRYKVGWEGRGSRLRGVRMGVNVECDQIATHCTKFSLIKNEKKITSI